MSEITTHITGGGTLDSIELNVLAALPTQGDLLYAMQRQKARILKRTEAGVDVDGKAFAPYNKTRPYYWYPAGRVGKDRSTDSLRKEKNNVKRAAKKLGGKTSRSGLGVRFDSYDAFKRQGLGRSKVDLRGPRAPHMLQEIDIKVGAKAYRSELAVGLNDLPGQATEGRIGIYGDAAKRASGHNSDNRPKGLPQRRFLGASESDHKAFAGDIESRAGDRARAALRGR